MDTCYVNESSTKIIRFNVVDSDGTTVPAANILTATLTLYDVETFEDGASPTTHIINNRDSQNVKNTNNVEINDTNPTLVTWTMQPADNPIITSRRQVERHRAQFHFTWATGTYNHDIHIEVRNMMSVAS